MLAEIQQTSDVTYRIYDWDRLDDKGNLRDLHTELAIDAINFEGKEEFRREFKPILNDSLNLANCEFFTTNIIELNKPLQRDYLDIDSFVIYICIEGNIEICYEDKTVSLKTGETILIPAELKELSIKPNNNAKILEVYIA